MQIYKLYFLTRKINLKYFLTLTLPLFHILLMNLQTLKTNAYPFAGANIQPLFKSTSFFLAYFKEKLNTKHTTLLTNIIHLKKISTFSIYKENNNPNQKNILIKVCLIY